MPFDIFIASDAHCTLWCLRHWHIPIPRHQCAERASNFSRSTAYPYLSL